MGKDKKFKNFTLELHHDKLAVSSLSFVLFALIDEKYLRK